MQTKVHKLLRRRDLGGGSYALEVEGPIPATQPGQFYMLRTEHRWPVQLPRPFSLYDRAADGSWGSFLIKPVGEGTRALETPIYVCTGAYTNHGYIYRCSNFCGEGCWNLFKHNGKTAALV